MPTKNKEKQLEYQRKHYKNNKEYYASRNKIKREKISNWIKEYKKKICCCRCGQNHPATLHFHHLNPEDKRYDISLMKNSYCSIKTIQDEIKKCIVLCANCHAIEHWPDNNIPSA